MSASPTDTRARFIALLTSAISDGTLVKLTLGKHHGADATLQNLFVRPVTLKAGPHLSLLWRHATRDITKNHSPADALALIEPLIGRDFLDGHLFTPVQTAQFETRSDGSHRLSVKTATVAPAPAAEGHDRAKDHLIPGDAPWLRALGVTNDRSLPREGMAHKFRQIQKFTELVSQLLTEAELISPDAEPRAGTNAPIRIADMGCGKGYLTFALAAHLGAHADVIGIEFRPELVTLCNNLARESGLAGQLRFAAGDIASTVLERLDVLVALHACDTATDDALTKGIAAGARLLVVSPCCQKELRSQLTSPPVLVDALRHGIFQERQSEFVTDSLRAMLLEWAGYRTKVFEFISTEHTAKNLMIAAIKTGRARGADSALSERIRAFAAFYGIRHQALATQLGFPFSAGS